MANEIALQLLPWDTAFFGVRIAKLGGSHLDAADLAAVDQWCVANAVACLYFLADPSSAPTLSAAFDGRFQFVDMRVDLELRDIEAAPTEAHPPGIRLATLEDRPSLAAMARDLHTNTRFFKDVGFPADRAAEMYAEWLRGSIEHPQKAVLVMTDPDDQIAGYVACEMPAALTGRIGLIGVSVSHRGQKIGPALVRAAIGWSRARGGRRMMVTTQADNTAALRLYQAAGFLQTSAAAWFHKWYL